MSKKERINFEELGKFTSDELVLVAMERLLKGVEKKLRAQIEVVKSDPCTIILECNKKFVELTKAADRSERRTQEFISKTRALRVREKEAQHRLAKGYNIIEELDKESKLRIAHSSVAYEINIFQFRINQRKKRKESATDE